MRVFVTGGSGFVGSAVIPELLSSGHQVVALARSEATASTLAEAGAEVRRGDLTDLDSLRVGAEDAEGVVHLAYIHDFSSVESFTASAQADARAVQAIGEVLAGSGRPLVIASGTAGLAPGRLATEEDPGDPANGNTRQQTERALMAMAESGVRSVSVRLSPTVHGEGDHGFVPQFVGTARTTGVSAYVEDGANRWPAVHRNDAAVLFRLALERAPAGSRLHAVDDEGVPFKDIAEVIARHLDVPLTSVPAGEAMAHFGFLGTFAGADIPASSAITRAATGWSPAQPGLLADLDAGHYFA
jgi:nucleoside-diphosphate-sugar epimerase